MSENTNEQMPVSKENFYDVVHTIEHKMNLLAQRGTPTKETNRQQKVQKKYSYQILSLKDVEEISSLYNDYKKEQENLGDKGNPPEFLYIPEYAEIKEHIQKQKGFYIGMVDKETGKIAGVAKIEYLAKGHGSFFVPPQQDREYISAAQNNDSPTPKPVFYGFSGLLVSQNHKQQGLAKYMTKISTAALRACGATGIYADCDYRNVCSFKTLSPTMDLVGYTDGRNGAQGEKTIYLTFYDSNNENYDYAIEKQNAQGQDTRLDLEEMLATDKNNVVTGLNQTLQQFGGTFQTKVAYGEKENIIHVLNKKIKTRGNLIRDEYDRIKGHEKTNNPMIGTILKNKKERV